MSGCVWKDGTVREDEFKPKSVWIECLGSLAQLHLIPWRNLTVEFLVLSLLCEHLFLPQMGPGRDKTYIYQSCSTQAGMINMCHVIPVWCGHTSVFALSTLYWTCFLQIMSVPRDRLCATSASTKYHFWNIVGTY
jgi:hypothetical protein